MKLRQKLAVVLASAMVVTAVPVVTMAASNNRLTKEIIKVEKGATFLDSATAPALRIDFKDAEADTNETFYLELTNAEWDEAAIEAFNSEFEYVSKTVLKVTATPSDSYKIPLLTKVTGGDASVEIKKMGSISTVTEGKFVYATTGEKAASFAVGTPTSFYTKGNIADISFTETFKGSLGTSADVTLTLQDGDFVFDTTNFTKQTIDEKDYYVGTVVAERAYGFGSGNIDLVAKVPVEDTGVMTITLATPSGVEADSQGVLKVKGLAVKATTKTPEAGDLLVDISGKQILDAKDGVKVATISAYATKIEMKDEKAVSIKAGEEEEVEFTISELVDDSMVGNREIEITLDNENVHFVNGSITVEDQRKEGTTNKVVAEDAISFEYVEDAKPAKGITKIIVKLNPDTQVNGEIDWFTIKAKVCVPVTEKDAESINIKAEGRALENEVSTKAVEIVNPFNVETEEMRVKVGLQGQVAGKITLTETDKAMFNKGTIELKLAKDAPAGIKIESVGTLEVTGDLKNADLTQVKVGDEKVNEAKITLNRQSKSASSITVSDIKVTVDRTVPEGKYDLVIGGTAIDGHNHEIVVKDFFVVGTPNTEDIAANGLRRGTTTFVIGESKYTANDVSYDMSAASYIQDPGYTMIPVRYVAEAFGVDQKDILFSAGTATIFAGERTIQLTNGSDIAVVNGAQIKMATKVVIKEGRTYAPVGEIAKILGIASSWDGTTKTATFTNK